MENLLDNSLVTAIVAGIVLGVLKAGKDESERKDERQEGNFADLDDPKLKAVLKEALAVYAKEAERKSVHDILQDLDKQTEELKRLNEDAYIEYAKGILDSTDIPSTRLVDDTAERLRSDAGR